MNCIDQYKNVYSFDPDNPWASAGMYRSAQLYLQIYKKFSTLRDKEQAVDQLNRIIRRYSSSAYKTKAKNLLSTISFVKIKNKKSIENKKSKKISTIKKKSLDDNHNNSAIKRSKKKETKKNITKKQKSYIDIKHKKTKENSKNNFKSASKKNNISTSKKNNISTSGDTLVTGYRYWSNPDYTRIVIDADNERDFNYHFLKKNIAINKPQRLYVDIFNSRLSKQLPKATPINDDLLTQVRTGQHTPHSVRIVIDIKSFDKYKIFSLVFLCLISI